VKPIAVKESPTLKLGPISFSQSIALINASEVITKVVESLDSLTFEELDVPYGFAFPVSAGLDLIER
jgi:hypothetical protein